jgi:hypothetical protein
MNTILANRITDKILNEQYSMYGHGMTVDQTRQAVKAGEDAFWNKYKHDIMTAAAIGALFIPIPGVNVALSALVSAADAGMYWAEGDRQMSMTMMAFALISGIGKLASKIPGVKQMTAKGMRILFRKLIQAKQGVKVVFSKLEQLVIKGLSANKRTVAKEIAKRSIELGKKIIKSKPARKVSRVAQRTPIGVGKFGAAAATTNAAVDYIVNPIYTAAGLDIADIEDGNRSDLDALVALNQKTK